MENMKSWAICVVVSSAVVAVVEALLPDGANEKPVKFITSVFILFAFVSPFADFEALSFDYTQGIDELVEKYELEQKVEEQAKESLETQIVSTLSAYIESVGAVCEGVDAVVVIDSDNNIYIDSITVCVSGANEETRRKISDYSRENFGVKSDIKVME